MLVQIVSSLSLIIIFLLIIFIFNILLKIFKINSAKRKLISSLVLLLISAVVSVTLYDKSSAILLHLAQASHLVVWVSAAWLAVSLMTFFIWDGVMADAEGFSTVPTILRLLFNYIVWLLFFALLMKHVFGQSIIGLMTASGVVAVIIGYASQGALSDIFCGITIALSKNIHKGDNICIHDKLKGTIVEMGWRSLKVKSWRGIISIISNSELAKSSIDNYSSNGGVVALTTSVDIGVHIDPQVIYPLLTQSAQDAILHLDVPVNTMVVLRGGITTIMNNVYYSYDVKFDRVSGSYSCRLEINRFYEILSNKLHKSGLCLEHVVGRLHQDMSLSEPPNVSPYKSDDIVSILESLDFMSGINLDQHRGQLSSIKLERFVANERIMVQGDEGNELFIIADGHCQVFETNADGVFGSMRHLHGDKESKIFDYFGLKGFLLNEPRRITVRAVTSSWILRVQRSDFYEFLSENKSAIDALVTILESRIKENTDTLDTLGVDLNDDKRSLSSVLLSKIEELFSFKS